MLALGGSVQLLLLLNAAIVLLGVSVGLFRTQVQSESRQAPITLQNADMTKVCFFSKHAWPWR